MSSTKAVFVFWFLNYQDLDYLKGQGQRSLNDKVQGHTVKSKETLIFKWLYCVSIMMYCFDNIIMYSWALMIHYDNNNNNIYI